MDDRKGKFWLSSSFDRILQNARSRTLPVEELYTDLRNPSEDDLHYLDIRNSIFCYLREAHDLPCSDDELRNLIAYEIANERSRMEYEIANERSRLKKDADDLNSALLSAKKKAGRDKRHVVLPPGSKLLTIAEFLYSKKTYTLRFKPIVADMQREYFEALYEKRVWKARWIHIRGCWGFINTIWLNIWVSLLDKAWKAWKMSDK